MIVSIFIWSCVFVNKFVVFYFKNLLTWIIHKLLPFSVFEPLLLWIVQVKYIVDVCYVFSVHFIY